MFTPLTDAQRALLDGFNPALKEAGLADLLDSLLSSAAADPGRRAINVLRVAANVVSTETVVIGGDTYEVNIVNTDTTVNVTGNELNNTDAYSTVTIAAHGLSMGDLIRVDTEIMKVIGIPSANSVKVKRGHSGTTIATHAANADIFKAGTPAGAGHKEVGLVTTLTPTAFAAALVAVINAEDGVGVGAVLISANEVLIVADQGGDVELACTETLSGANNVWSAAAMYGGRAPGPRRIVAQTRVPTATEAALGNLHFEFDFAPTVLGVFVRVTATPALAVACDGAITVTGNRVTLDASGSTDWTTSHTVILIVSD